MNHKSQHEAGRNKKIVFESVFILLVCLFHYFMVPHVPDNSNWSSHEDQLHYSVVVWDVSRKQIKVASGKDYNIEFLSLQRDSWSKYKLAKASKYINKSREHLGKILETNVKNRIICLFLTMWFSRKKRFMEQNNMEPLFTWLLWNRKILWSPKSNA